MERVLESIKVEGTLFKVGDIVRARNIPNNRGEGYYGEYTIEAIINDDGDIFFDLESLEDGDYISGRWSWRFEKAKNTNKGAY